MRKEKTKFLEHRDDVEASDDVLSFSFCSR